MAIRDGRLYRDRGTFDDYVESTFDVKPGSAYRWIDAAETVKDVIDKISPKGEIDDPEAWNALVRHRNETAIRFLQELPAVEDQWAVYKKAVELSRGREPKPRLLKKAAQELGIIPQKDTRDSRTLDRAQAFKLILDVQRSAKQDGRNLWAAKLDDALHRLGYRPNRFRAPQLRPKTVVSHTGAAASGLDRS